MVDQTSGMKCVIKVVDEETKNHKTIDSEITTGRMPQMPGSKYCPVSSFETYMAHLSIKSEWLWQTPKYNKFSAKTGKYRAMVLWTFRPQPVEFICFTHSLCLWGSAWHLLQPFTASYSNKLSQEGKVWRQTSHVSIRSQGY